MSAGVSVSYTFNPNTALVGILVEDLGSGLHFVAAVPALVPGEWTVTFELVAGEGINSLSFDEEDGIVINALPSLLTVGDSAFVDPTHWETDFTSAVISANQAQYTINGTANGTPFSHDPTIAVTSDPIG